MSNSSGSASSDSFPDSSSQAMPVYDDDLHDPIIAPAATAMEASLGPTPTSELLYNLSMLKDKVSQVESLVTIMISSDQGQHPMAVAGMNSVVQEIMVTASSFMLVCQQMSLSTTAPTGNYNYESSTTAAAASNADLPDVHTCLYSTENDQSMDTWLDENCNNNGHDEKSLKIANEKLETSIIIINSSLGVKNDEMLQKSVTNNYSSSDIIEVEAADLLAKYTNYCQVCGKGFKRDANLRMHMRAHGDEYKTSAALSNPTKMNKDCFSDSMKSPKKYYSCPFEGCKWNQRHAKFQPLKSMVCVKNHYKRSHCPKMYVCKRCSRKQFSVLSDLRTHEKHCGDMKWQCSCGTTFSRKDKLMGHVTLFIGHTPILATSSHLNRP